MGVYVHVLYQKTACHRVIYSLDFSSELVLLKVGRTLCIWAIDCEQHCVERLRCNHVKCELVRRLIVLLFIWHLCVT